MTMHVVILNETQQITVPNEKIAPAHLASVACDAKIRARGLLESTTFLAAHINGLPAEFQDVIDTAAVVASYMQKLQAQLERIAKDRRAGALES